MSFFFRAEGGLSRRAFLRGVGTTAIALPALELTHGKAWASSGEPPFFVGVYNCGGTVNPRHRITGTLRGADTASYSINEWRPSGEGNNFTLGPIHSRLVGMESDLVFLSGVDNATRSIHPHGGAHRWADASVLTANVRAAGEDPIGNGPSIDQVLAQRLQAQRPRPHQSIDLNLWGGIEYGEFSYRASGQSISRENDPREAFGTLFGQIADQSGSVDPALMLRRRKQRSILDGVLAGLNLIKVRVGQADRLAIDAHLEHIRALELRLDELDEIVLDQCGRPDQSSASGLTDGLRHAQDITGPLHADLIVQAMRCGLTNVASLRISDFTTEFLNSPLSDAIGSRYGHTLGHDCREVGPVGNLSNWQQQWRDEIITNRAWRVGLFQRIVQGLKDTPYGNSHMLDHALVYWVSEFSNASVHCVRDLPIMMAGSACGRIPTGRHLDYNTAANNRELQTQESIHNVYTSVLRAFQFEDEHFGDGRAYHRGELPGLVS